VIYIIIFTNIFIILIRADVHILLFYMYHYTLL